MYMATDKDILDAEKRAKEEAFSALERELLSEATLQVAMKSFGWGQNKLSIITLKAVMRSALEIAMKKAR